MTTHPARLAMMERKALAELTLEARVERLWADCGWQGIQDLHAGGDLPADVWAAAERMHAMGRS